MGEEEVENNICRLEPGDEEAVFDALGPFDEEACGILFRCSHKVDKYYLKKGLKQHVRVHYCAVNWGMVCTILFLLFVAYLFTKMKTAKANAVSSLASSAINSSGV